MKESKQDSASKVERVERPCPSLVLKVNIAEQKLDEGVAKPGPRQILQRKLMQESAKDQVP